MPIDTDSYEHYNNYVRLRTTGVFGLNLNKLVIFRYISTQVGDKVYIFLFNSCVRFR